MNKITTTTLTTTTDTSSLTTVTVTCPSKKRGGLYGASHPHTKTQDDWYYCCSSYRKEYPRMKQSTFLRSEHSGTKFTGTISEQQSFSRKLKMYDTGKLTPGSLKRQQKQKYEDIAQKLVKYLDLHEQKFREDKTGVSWVVLVSKSLHFAELLGYDIGPAGIFKASPGWISEDCLRTRRLRT